MEKTRNLKEGKRVFIHRLYTLKGKPLRVNKRTKILSKFDVKIHQMNHSKMPIRVQKFTKCTKFYENMEISSPSVLELGKNSKEKYTK